MMKMTMTTLGLVLAVVNESGFAVDPTLIYLKPASSLVVKLVQVI